MLPIALSILGFVVVVGVVIGALSGVLTASCKVWTGLAAANPRTDPAPDAARGSCIAVIADSAAGRGRRHNVNYSIDRDHLHLSLDSGPLAPSRPLSIAWARCALVPVPPQKRAHMGEYTAIAMPPWVIALPLTVIERAWDFGVDLPPIDMGQAAQMGLNAGGFDERAAPEPTGAREPASGDVRRDRRTDGEPGVDPYAPRGGGRRDPWEILDIPPARRD